MRHNDPPFFDVEQYASHNIEHNRNMFIYLIL